MIGKGALAASVLATVGCLLPVAAEAREETISKREVRTDPPNMTHAQLRDVVWDMFEVQDYRRDESPTRPLDSLHLRTRTHATLVPNLCRYDVVWVDFEEATPDDAGADAASKAVSLSSTSYWTFVGAPPGLGEDWWRERPVSVEECAKLPDDRAAFAAPDELEAVEGYLAWIVLRQTIEREDEFPLECNLWHNETKSCEQLITEASLDSVTDIRRCTSGDGGRCYQLTLDDRRIIVDFDLPVSSRNPRVAKVKYDSLIILSHERSD